jgi:hypothetical protein
MKTNHGCGRSGLQGSEMVSVAIQLQWINRHVIGTHCSGSVGVRFKRLIDLPVRKLRRAFQVLLASGHGPTALLSRSLSVSCWRLHIQRLGDIRRLSGFIRDM